MAYNYRTPDEYPEYEKIKKKIEKHMGKSLDRLTPKRKEAILQKCFTLAILASNSTVNGVIKELHKIESIEDEKNVD
jgi:hypothetical protein